MPRFALTSALLLASFLCGPAAAQALITVTTAGDEPGDCSLREAIEAASSDAAVGACAAGSGSDTIVFDEALSGATIALGGTQLTLSSDLTIDASALPGGITISGDGQSRVFQITSGQATLRALTVTGGVASRGGGVLVSGGSATLERVTVTGNDGGDYGGGVQVNTGASLTLRNVTVEGNTTTTGGSGIWVFGGTLDALHVTVANNSNDGVFVDWFVNRADPVVTLTNTILADNGGYDWRNPSSGTVTLTRTLAEARSGSGDFKGLTADPLLLPLADNGGPVPTMMLRSGSPATDVADVSTCPATDARGTARHDFPGVGSSGTTICDLGAFEQGAGENVPPYLPVIADQLSFNTDPHEVGLAVLDDDPDSITLSVESSNPAVLPVENIVVSGTGTDRILTLTATGAPGESTITITASDGVDTVTTGFVFSLRKPSLFRWSTGATAHYFPTTTGRYHIIDSDDIDPATYGDGVFYLDLEILATGFWPGQAGFAYGVAGYPLAQSAFHELGQFADEWAYRSRDGRAYVEGVTSPFGRIVNQVGDKVRIWYDSRTDELSMYTMRASESAWTLEGSRVVSAGVVPEEGRVLRFAASGVCWQLCGVKIVGSGVPPRASDAMVTLAGGPAHTFAAADFNFDDQGDGDALDRIQVVSLPVSGTLFLDANEDGIADEGEILADGAEVLRADLGAGRLKFRPDAAEVAAFTFRVHDGTAYTTGIYTMTVDAGALPVELAAFAATADGPDVLLRWTTASETNNAGFEIEQQVEALEGGWQARGFVAGSGTTAEAQAYTHRVTGLAPGAYRFRLKQIDFDGAAAYSPEVEVTVGVPAAYALSAPSPNPFNAQTQFTLAVEVAQPVHVAAYDVLGRRVVVLHEDVLAAGEPHRFGIDGAGLPSGTYVIRAQGETFEVSRMLMLVK